MSLYEIVTTFESIGVFDIALPFLLVFTITFGILQKIQLFGTNKKNIDLIVSLVLAFLAIRNLFFIDMLNRFLPNVAMLLIIILMFLLFLGTFGGVSSGFQGVMAILALLFSAIAVLLALGSDLLLGYGFIMPPFLTDFLYDYQTRATLLFIGGMVIVILLATQSGNSQTTWTQWLQERAQELGFGRNR